VEYALLALLELAGHAQGSPLKISEIAAKQAIPDRYLEQILNSLRRSGIIQSLRGAKGGYVLAREPWQITLLEVVISVEGDLKPKESKGSESSTLEKDVVYEIWQQVHEEAQKALNRYTLQDLCQRRDAYRQINVMYYI
ncbi:MAG: RrF2 family transcriptional regulator, partial [Microcystaceae cyanobacterium]